MKRGYVKLILGIIFLLGGGLLLPAGVMVSAFNSPDEEVTFESPGEASLEIVSPGRFYLWHEYRTIHDGRQLVRNEYLPDGMSFDVKHAGTESSLDFEPRGNIHTKVGNAASRSIFYVDIERPGRVEIQVGGGDGQMRVMSFSRSRFMLFTRAVGISLLSLLVFGTAGVVLIVFGVAQRGGAPNSN